MAAIQQGRLWAVRNGPNSPIFYDVEKNLPILSTTKKGIKSIKKWIDGSGDCNVEIIEVEIIKKK